MENKVFIIHNSDIIKLGLYSIIKKLFGIEATILNVPDELKNFSTILKSTLILIVDARLNHQNIDKSLQIFDKSIKKKIILVHENSEQSDCEEQCTCCFALDDSRQRIENLLMPYFNDNKNQEVNNATLLSERESDVVKLVALGKTNKEIAEKLFISVHTVISHRKNITEKLGIKSISGLTVYAILNNLIDASSVNLE